MYQMRDSLVARCFMEAKDFIERRHAFGQMMKDGTLFKIGSEWYELPFTLERKTY
jgi:hypothetical protein